MLPAPRPATSDAAVPSYEELEKKTIAQLKVICSAWGLPVSGNKGVLISRLRASGGPKSERPQAELRPALPVSAGPWMQRCVKTWKLAAPYNTAVSPCELSKALVPPARPILRRTLDCSEQCVCFDR